LGEGGVWRREKQLTFRGDGVAPKGRGMPISGVEACRDQDEVGRKLASDWHHQAPECGQIFRVTKIRYCIM